MSEEKKQMVFEKTWEEFRTTGLLYFINSFMHIFGWCIVFEVDAQTNKVSKVYPAKTQYRGYNTDVSSNNYIKISKLMKDNAEELLKEAEK